MKHSAKILSQTIAQFCLSKGIHHIIISPGSRNAPLSIEFSNNPKFHCYSIVDERCAAFFALGIAQQLQHPTALVCTSGSALLNYYPAIAEAYYSDIPLIVLSADRPEHLIEIGDGQTIKQENVYDNHIEYSANCLEGVSFQPYNETVINDALNTAISRKGPVHINLPFSEPLYDLVETPSISIDKEYKKEAPDTYMPNSDWMQQWNTATKKMVLVGTLFPNALETSVLDQLLEDPSVLLLTETTSNLHHKQLIPNIDQLISNLSETQLEALQPEVLVSFGGMIVSKRIKAFLRKYPPKNHYHVDPKKAYDTFFCLTDHYQVAPNHFFKTILPKVQFPNSDYQSYWLMIHQTKLSKQEHFNTQVGYSDYWVYQKVFKSLPQATHLQIANSAAIRYSQLFAIDPSVAVFCNRGTSGIDGSTSTAIGAAVTLTSRTIFVTGDLSFFYDSNALWNHYIPKDFRIILINNSGGGIFRILPKAKEMQHFETYFETRHHLNAKHLCEMYQWDYYVATNKQSLNDQLESFYAASNSPKLLEVCTPPEINDSILNAYFDAILLLE